DAAGDDQLAGRVDHPRALRRQRPRGGDGDDALAVDPDVPCAHALGRDDLPTANEEIDHVSLRYAFPKESSGDASRVLDQARQPAAARERSYRTTSLSGLRTRSERTG